MIRIGYLIEDSQAGWTGGINYFRNLINSLLKSNEKKIVPVIITGVKFDMNILKEFPEVEILQTRMLDTNHLFWFFRKVCKRLLSYDWFLEKFLLRRNISLLSHSGYIGSGSKVLTIGWIPDFQHKYLPQFFSKREIKSRDREYRNQCRFCSRILLSSYSAQSDLEKFHSPWRAKSRVFHFVVDPVKVEQLPSREKLEEVYDFKCPYFHLPNQFWAHKNHRVVIDALRILKRSGKKVLVLATGNTKDYRRPEYYQSLTGYIKESHVEDYFKILGMVPGSDLYALMRYSIAVINPSFFEGWSTTVEEAKTFGKRIILSDIPVHKEQAPPGGYYFNPEKPEELAEMMWTVSVSKNNEIDQELIRVAQENSPERKREFSKKYTDIVIEVVNESIKSR